ncbi:uncharacterized protein LOC130442486 [Diorhabda sublineata]|uniref:uncharacterized protein LOC130442486 n=1 Tax=Diorhabda sublineata TaxID=1163346 RepID=UPI0024E14F53|nr:uncharacterized protein LOC130442486 [Diorhabda sublineata]
MPQTCLVLDCGSRSNRDDVRFFSIPAELSFRFVKEKNELSKKRRALWIAAINRDDLTESKLKNQRVCSKHFITGKPAALEEYSHPDWIPSQNMGRNSPKVQRQSDDENILYTKRFKSGKFIKLDESNITVHVETGIASQTDLTMNDLYLKFDQLSCATRKMEDLEKKLDMSPFGLQEETSNDLKWKYYTGFTYNVTFYIIFKTIETSITTQSTNALSSFNQLLLALIKLRLNYDFCDLAWHFKISPTSSFTYFENILNILYTKFKHLIRFPDRLVAQKNIPSCFGEAFQDKTTVIVDCFEFFIEKPHQQQYWSKNKHDNIIKFLIGFTPQGTVSYVSKAWEGTATDEEMVANSDFLNYISPGDVVLANRGFLIEDTSEDSSINCVIQVFIKIKDQLHPLDMELTRNVSHVRIHVKKIVGMMKNKFKIVKDTIPISLIKKGSNPEDRHILDKIVVVCCALMNLCSPIVPL